MALFRTKARGGWLNSLYCILLLPVYLMSHLYRRDPNLYLFGSGHGDRFIDNSKYLFLYFAKNHSDKKAVFVSKNKKVVADLTKAGYKAVDSSTWRGKRTVLRAGTCFISHSSHDIHPILIGGARIIQLWHGTPLKKIAYDSRRVPRGLLAKLKYWLRHAGFKIFPYLNSTMNFDYLIASSEKVVKHFSSAFQVKQEKILVMGQCRNDALLENYEFDQQLFPETKYLQSLTKERQRIISWLPTHRLISGSSISNLIENYKLDQKKLSQLLEQHNTQLVIKAHPLDQGQIKEQLINSHITIYPYVDPNPLLRSTDLLITDYSGVYFDFLLLDRPIIFACFDYQSYMKDDASLYFDYNKVTPGPKCYDWIELIQEIETHLTMIEKSELDQFAEARKECHRTFNSYTDSICARVANQFLTAKSS